MYPATVRLALNDRSPLSPFTLSFWQGAAARIEFAIFEQGSTTQLVSDFGNLTSIQMEVKSGKTGGGNLLIAIDPIPIGDLDPNLTVAQWNAGTHKHGVIELTSDQMSQVVAYGVLECWATIFSITDDNEKIVHGAGAFNIYKARHDAGGTPPEPPELYYTKSEMDALLAGIPTIEATESPYAICDSEAHLDVALAQGKWAVIRGEGNNGIVNVTSQKNISVRGTKILGYGHKPGVTGYFGKIKANMPNVAIAEAFAPLMFNIQTNDFEASGLEIEGRDSLDAAYWSYIAFYLSPFHALSGINIHDNKIVNMSRALGKWGFFECEISRNIAFERNHIVDCSHAAIGLQQGIYNSVFRNNVFDMRADAAPATFTDAQGISLFCDIRDCLTEGNIINNPNRMGIESIAVEYPSIAPLQPMWRNRFVGNIINNAGSAGISVAFTPSALIHNNTINGARYIGIESANGSTLGQNPNTAHSAIITANRVLGIHSDLYSTGISCDQSANDIVEGNHVEGVTSDYTGVDAHYYARGILMSRTRNGMISGNHVFNCDGNGVLIQGLGVPANEGQAVVQNNVFRVTEAQTKALYAVFVEDARAVVRNNVSWEPQSGIAQGKYFVGTNDGQPVYTGTAGNIAVNTFFTDTNLVLPFSSTIPVNAIVDENGNALIDENGDFILAS